MRLKLSFCFICATVLLFYLNVFALSNEVQSSSKRYNEDQTSEQIIYENTTNVTTCPLWFLFNNSTKECECGNDLGGVIYCDSEYKRVYILNCNCMTQDDSLGVVVGSCLTNCFIPKSNTTFEMYLRLPKDPHKLNDAMCGERWNRTGRLCGKCKRALGYYPLVYSYDMNCVQCKNHKYNCLTFITEAFLPLTVFFVFIISTGVSASSPTLDAFIVFSQTVASAANVRLFLEATQVYPTSSTPIRIITALYSIWNLDFFRTLLPPNCLKISTLQGLALDYVIAFYPLVLIIITYILVFLYDKRFFLLVWMWKPFQKLCKPFSSRINIQSSIINAFVTFLLLSYVKLLSVSFDLLNFTTAYYPDGRHIGWFLFYDSSISYFGSEHFPYGVTAVVVLLLFNILPLLFGLLHILRCFNSCIGRWPALRICLDSYQGYYKDGTDGNRDYRWFSSFYLFVRIVLFLVYSFIKNVYFYAFASILLLFVVAIIIVCQPFKPQFGKYNTIHALLFLNLAIWFGSVVCITISSLKAHNLTTFSMYSSTFIVVLPLVYITFVVLKWIYLQKAVWNLFVKYLSYCYRFTSVTQLSQDKDSDSIDSLPYRIEHSNEEQLLIQPNLFQSAKQDYGGIK